jgi:hypothetical protein
MKVKMTVGMASLSKTDKKAAEKLADSEGADKSRVRTYIDLLNKAEDGSAELTSFKSALDKWMGEECPSKLDGGWRLIPVQVMEDAGIVTTRLKDGKSGGVACKKHDFIVPDKVFQSRNETADEFSKRVGGRVTNSFEFIQQSASHLTVEFENAVNKFIDEGYTPVYKERLEELGGLGKDNYYLEPDKLRQKYHIKFEFDVPDGADISALTKTIGGKKMEKIVQESAERKANEMMEAKGSALAQFIEPIKHLLEKINEQDEDTLNRKVIEDELDDEKQKEYDKKYADKLAEVQKKKPKTKKLTKAQELSIKKEILGIGKAKQYPSNCIEKIMKGAPLARQQGGMLTDEEQDWVDQTEAIFSVYDNDDIKNDPEIRSAAKEDAKDALSQINDLFSKFNGGM